MRFSLIFTLFILFSQQISASKAPELSSGVMQGHTTETEAYFWLMVRHTDTVKAVLFLDDKLQKELLIPIPKKKNHYKNHSPVHLHFDELIENGNYRIELELSKKSLKTKATKSFRTLQAEISGDYSFLIGSCAFIGTDWTAGLKPGKDLRIFNTMAKEEGEFMLWLGDNLYYIYEFKRKGMFRKNVKVRQKEPINNLIKTRRHYAIWDDHDYGPNNSGANFKGKYNALELFQKFWANGEIVGPEQNYYSFKHGEADFFMTDSRWNKIKKPEMEILGHQQIEWLKKELKTSTATFKFVCSGVQVLNEVTRSETLYKAKKEHQELLDFIKREKIEGVVFISGDRHHSEVFKKEQEGCYPLYELTSSPMTSWPRPLLKSDPEFNNPLRIEGLFTNTHNFGKISLSGPDNDRKCLYECIDKNGELIWKVEFQSSELKFK